MTHDNLVDIFSLNINDKFIAENNKYTLIDKVTIPAGFTELQLAKGLNTETNEELILESGTKVEIVTSNKSVNQTEINYLKQRLYESFQVNTQTDMFNKIKQLNPYPTENQNDFLVELLSGLNAAIIFNLMKEDPNITYTKSIRKINKDTKLTLQKFKENYDEFGE